MSTTRQTQVATNTLSKAAFFLTVLSERTELHNLAFNTGMFSLELQRPPASTKALEVQSGSRYSTLHRLENADRAKVLAEASCCVPFALPRRERPLREIPVRCKRSSRPPTLVLNMRYAEKTGGNVCVSSSSTAFESRLYSDEASVEAQVAILLSAFLTGTLKSRSKDSRLPR